ncbi:MAG: pyruvate dehydrogenase [Anaerolineae bacterium]|nr:pyruvate dehydrogenase [Anaerolineae bacterium]
MVTSLPPDRLIALNAIERRVLWLATAMIHHANHVRPNPDGVKIGGHQASSASMVTILTALYFHFLRAGDRVSIKPHASPAFHAIQYLLGQLPREYLTTLRAYHGLQAYPSRTKDPDHVDFSTGSVGLGAVAPAFAAAVQRYARTHFGSVTSRRFIAVMGDAELDEGNVWEAVAEDALAGLDNLLWIVDLNRQSLDRVVPGIRAARLKRMFADWGWNVLEAKYGRRLQALFARSGGPALRDRIDHMSNEEYQALIRLPGPQLRPRLVGVGGRDSLEVARAIQTVSDDELPAVLANLGGHDMEEMIEVLNRADQQRGQPSVIFAYTVKGYGLPFAGHPLNHSMLLSPTEIEGVREALGIPPGQEWDAFDPVSPPGRLCQEAAGRLFTPAQPAAPRLQTDQVPPEVGVVVGATISTQEAFGRLLVKLADDPTLRPHIVTTSPDVSVSTNLGGWINKVGVFAPAETPDYHPDSHGLVRWKPSPVGQHIELGISEMNLFMLLGMAGLADEMSGQALIPIGTVYDPFVLRGLDALVYALYSGSKFIFAGTPSGITLSPEGGAHQSSVTPSLGIELPRLQSYEPCFAREVEWTLLEGIRHCLDRGEGKATYLRLSTRPVDQTLLDPALNRLGSAELRRQVLAGGYRLLDWREAADEIDPRTVVHIAATGVMVPEAVEAARYLWREGVAANVLNLVSPRRLFEAWQARRTDGTAMTCDEPLTWLIRPEDRSAPIVTVQDGASHSLAWLGSMFGAPVTALGVDQFGQSGARGDLYRNFGLDVDSLIAAAFDALDAHRSR